MVTLASAPDLAKIPTVRVDLLELNEVMVYIGEGTAKLERAVRQFLFYESLGWGAFQIRDYKVDDEELLKPIPAGDEWHLNVRDPCTGEYLVIIADRFLETQTLFDPELRERYHTPAEERRHIFDRSPRKGRR